MKTPSLLTKTTKMGCSSWSIPAGPEVCAGFHAGPESVCRSCYAAQGMYTMPCVRNAQAYRLDRWQNDPTIDAELIAAINRTRSGYFRVFDSGDFTTVNDIDRWHVIAAACPTVRFWIPTRVWRLGSDWQSALNRLNALPNVCVRASGLKWDEPADSTLPLATLVTDDSGDCPATLNHSSCVAESCRKCWDKANAETRISRHGRSVNWKNRG